MQIEIVPLDRSRAEDRHLFTEFPKRFYGSDRTAAFHLSKTDGMIQSQGDFEIYLARKEGGDLLGRMAAGLNEDLKDENGLPYGYVGLFEAVEDFDCFCRMLEYAKDLLRKKRIRSVLFPFFDSTYYPYRFTSRGRDTFQYFLEYPDQPHYALFSHRSNLEVIYSVSSFLTFDLDYMIDRGKGPYEQACRQGITFRNIDPSNLNSELQILYGLSRTIFSRNPFYTDISLESFSSYYKGTLKASDPAFLRIAMDKESKPVGFSFSMPDFSRDPVEGLIFKTVAVLPAYRKYGILRGWSYLDCQLAKERSYHYAISAYLTDPNLAHKYFGPNTQRKEHELYRIRL